MAGVSANGIQYEFEWHGYRAVVTGTGAGLRLLQHDGRDLIVGFPADEPMPNFRGALAAPWPNRIASGRYPVDGVDRQLPVNEPGRECALHGLVFDRNWRLLERTTAEVVLGLRLPSSAGYPFDLDLVARYELGPDGLTTTVEATNVGGGTAPYGVCPHPYLRAGDSPLNSWLLTLPADSYLRVTPDRLLPAGLAEVADGPDGSFDFRRPRSIGATKIDHAFTGIVREPARKGSGRDGLVGGSLSAELGTGLVTVELREVSGRGVAMSFGPECGWLQIHTADLPAPGLNRLGLAVEPMTCPPDAFNSGTDLIRLAPGESHRASWSIRALE